MSVAQSMQSQRTLLREAKRRTATMLTAIASLHREGKRVRCQCAIASYAKSPAVMLASMDRAYQRLGTKRWFKDEEALRGLRLMTTPREPLSFYHKRKRSGSFRTIVVPGVERMACQLAVVDLLKALRPLKPWQYDQRGMGRDRAIREICTQVQRGKPFYAVCDIADCFQSFDREEIPNLLPLPKMLTKHHVLLCDHDGTDSPTAGSGSTTTRNRPRPLHLCGLPQGSVLSNYVSSILLSNLDEIVGVDVDVFLYRDDFVLLGKSARRRDEAVSTLIDGLVTHRAGCLRLRRCDMGDIRKEPLEYLGYAITKRRGRPVVRLGEANKEAILADVWQPAIGDAQAGNVSIPRTRAFLKKRLSGFQAANTSDIRSEAYCVGRALVAQYLPVLPVPTGHVEQ